MIRIYALLMAIPTAVFAQGYIATEVGQPCPPNSTLVWLKPNTGPACAVTSTITPLENPLPPPSETAAPLGSFSCRVFASPEKLK